MQLFRLHLHPLRCVWLAVIALTWLASCGDGLPSQDKTAELLVKQLTTGKNLTDTLHPGNLEKAIRTPTMLTDKYRFTACTVQVESLTLQAVRDQTKILDCTFLVTGTGTQLMGFGDNLQPLPGGTFSVKDLRLQALITTDASDISSVEYVHSERHDNPTSK